MIKACPYGEWQSLCPADGRHSGEICAFWDDKREKCIEQVKTDALLEIVELLKRQGRGDLR